MCACMPLRGLCVCVVCVIVFVYGMCVYLCVDSIHNSNFEVYAILCVGACIIADCILRLEIVGLPAN